MDQASGLHKLSFLKVRNHRTKNNTCQAKMDKYMNIRKFSVSKSSKKITYWAYWAIITSNTPQGSELVPRHPCRAEIEIRDPKPETRLDPGAPDISTPPGVCGLQGAPFSPKLLSSQAAGGWGLSWVPGTLSVDFAATPQKTTTLNVGCKIDSERPSFQGRGGGRNKDSGEPPLPFLAGSMGRERQISWNGHVKNQPLCFPRRESLGSSSPGSASFFQCPTCVVREWPNGKDAESGFPEFGVTPDGGVSRE